MPRVAALRLLRLAALAICACAAPGLASTARAGDAKGPPKIRTVSPTSAARGATVDVTIEGANLYPVEDVSVGTNDIGAVLQPGNGEFKLVVRLTIPDSAPAGSITITVKTKEGTVKTDRFSVRLRTPTVTKAAPTVIHRGATVDVVLTGTLLSFPGYDTKITTDGGIVTALSPKSTPTSLAMKVTVPMTAPAGPHAFVIETLDGKVSVPFTVVLSPPTIASVTPATIARGSSAELALAGTNLVGGSLPILAIPDSAVRLEASGETTMTATALKVTVLPDAPLGPRLLVLQTPDGVATIRFHVVGTPPRAGTAKPASSPRATSVEAVLEGAGVPADAEWRFVPEDPTVRLERTPGGARKIVVAPDARPGARTLVAVTRDGATTAPFHVALKPPAVAGVSPAEVAPGAEATIAVEGQNLEGTTLSLADSGDGVEAAPAASAKGGIHVKVAAGARPGPRAILLRGADGSAVAKFVVTGPAAAAPSVESSTPGRVARGRATQVTLSGINFQASGGAAPAVAVRGADDAPLPLKVVSSAANRLVLEVTPPAGAPLGGGVIVVKTAEGTAVCALSIDPLLPSIASATPSSLPRPGDTDVTLEGKGLVGPDGAAPRVVLRPAQGKGEILATIVSSAAERVVVKAAVPPDAAPGTWLLVLTTDEGGAAAVVTLEKAPPSIDSMDPRSIGVPATLEFVIAGKNLAEPDGKPPKVAAIRVGSSSTVVAQAVKATADGLVVRVRTPDGALGGPHLLVVTTVDGYAAAGFEVVAVAPPVVLGIDVSESARMANVMTTIRGTALSGATEVQFDGGGVTATILPGGNEKELLVRIAVAKDAAAGAHAFRVVTPGGISRGGEKAFFTVK